MQHCISVSFRAMGKATIMTSKAHYASFVKGGWGGVVLLDGNQAFFSRPLHVQPKLSIQKHFPIRALSS